MEERVNARAQKLGSAFTLSKGGQEVFVKNALLHIFLQTTFLKIHSNRNWIDFYGTFLDTDIDIITSGEQDAL